jgi:hypothetical protein
LRYCPGPWSLGEGHFYLAKRYWPEIPLVVVYLSMPPLVSVLYFLSIRVTCDLSGDELGFWHFKKL